MSLIGHSEFGLDYIPQIDKNLKYSETFLLDIKRANDSGVVIKIFGGLLSC